MPATTRTVTASQTAPCSPGRAHEQAAWALLRPSEQARRYGARMSQPSRNESNSKGELATRQVAANANGNKRQASEYVSRDVHVYFLRAWHGPRNCSCMEL